MNDKAAQFFKEAGGGIFTAIFLSVVFVAGYVCPAFAGGYFTCTDMDYFSPEGACKKETQELKASQGKHSEIEKQGFTQQQVEMWAEPTVDSSGKIISKLPPLPVLKMLVEPNEENARMYLEWNKKRLAAINKAQAILKEISAPESKAAEAKTEPPIIKDVKQIRKVSFFFSPTCPYCMQEAPMIEGLARAVGYDNVTAYTASGDAVSIGDFIRKTTLRVPVYVRPAEFNKNAVSAVPVTIIETTDGRKLRFEGYTDSFTGAAANSQSSDSANSPAKPGQTLDNISGGQTCGAESTTLP